MSLDPSAQALGDARDLLALGAQQYRRQLMQHQLLAHESAANDALNQYRLQGDELWRQYGGTRQREAVEGHDTYQQGLQGARAQAQQGLSAASLTLLREALHQEHQDRVRLGEAHRAVQDQAWSDQSSLDTLAVNRQAAVLHRDDPARVQALAQRGDGAWLKLGERRGWSDRQIGEQVRAWRGQVYGAVIDQQLHEGNVAGASNLLARVQGELDAPTADALGDRIVLANARIQDQRNAPVVVSDAGSDGGVGGGEDSIGGGTGGDQPYGGDGKDTLTDNARAGVQVAQNDPQKTGVLGNAGTSSTSGNPQVSQNSVQGNSSPAGSDHNVNGQRGLAPPTEPAVSGVNPDIPQKIPHLFREADRRRSILQNTPAIIYMQENPRANGSRPLYEEHYVGKEAVDKYDALIRSEAEKEGVDPDLVRAIIYMEESHGNYYGLSDILERQGWAKSLMPMNIRPNFWGQLSPDHPDLKDPQANIHAGVVLLKRIIERVSDPTIEKIATLYNSMSADRVNDYGKRVAEILKHKPWLGPPRNPTPLPAGVQFFPPFGPSEGTCPVSSCGMWKKWTKVNVVK